MNRFFVWGKGEKIAIFSPHPKTESLFTGYFIIDPRQTTTQVKLVSYTMKFGLNSLYSVAILVDSSLFTKPHVPRYYAFIRYHVKTEIFPKNYFIFIFILCRWSCLWLLDGPKQGPKNFFNETLRRGSARQGTQVVHFMLVWSIVKP